MNRIHLFLALTIFAVACNGKSYTPAPLDAPNRQNQHVPASCPMWNGTFVGKNNGGTKILQMRYDKNYSLILNENTNTTWVITGKPQHMGSNPSVSYTAHCESSTTTEDGKPNLTSTGGIIIEVYESGHEIFKIGYVTATNGFSYSRTDDDGVVRELPDTYAPPPTK